MTTLDVFHSDDDRTSFEALARENGMRYWWSSSLAHALGYDDASGVKKAIEKATAVCLNLGIPLAENFQQGESEYTKNDLKLSRFACYLVVMNGDVRNSLVAKAQAYFASIAEEIAQNIARSDGVERVLIRGEITERESSLSHTAKNHGVENFPFFQNAGYRGLYNMNLARLKSFKGMPKEAKGSLLDFMGKEELAANLFRITQTEAKIRKENTQGQSALESAAESVGRDVRLAMIKISGQHPESLPLEQNIADVKKGLKHTSRELKKLDSKKKN